VTPFFVGAHPAAVRDGPNKGFRLLGASEDLARQIMTGLPDAQRRTALIANRSFGEIVASPQREQDLGQPSGLELGAMNGSSRQLVETLRADAVTSLDWAHPILDAEATAQGCGSRSSDGTGSIGGVAGGARALGSLTGRRRRRLARMIATAQRFARMREEVVASLTLGYPTLRRALLGIGRSLVERGLLRHESDVMFLGRADLDRALGGATAAADLARVVVENQRLWQRRRRLSAPLQIGDPRIWTIYQRMNSKALRGPACGVSDEDGNGNERCGDSGKPGTRHGSGAHRAGSRGIRPRRRRGRADRAGDGSGLDGAVRAGRRRRHRHRQPDGPCLARGAGVRDSGCRRHGRRDQSLL
jgi:hypothetical protein